MENIRTIKITVEVDTNKQTYRKEFDTMEAAQEWYDELLADLE